MPTALGVTPLVGRVGPKWVSLPTGTEALVAMGEPLTDPLRVGTADAVVALVTSAARGYTRGRGFRETLHGEPPGAVHEVADDIAGAITTAALRLFSNPTAARRIEAGNFSTVPGSFEGWTTSELVVLRRYRRTVA